MYVDINVSIIRNFAPLYLAIGGKRGNRCHGGMRACALFPNLLVTVHRNLRREFIFH